MLTAACGERADEPAAADEHDAADEHAVSWTYHGDGGPESWAGISPEFAVCGSGTEQSPIDLSGASTSDLPTLGFDYPMASDEVQHNGHTVVATPTSAGFATLTGGPYQLLQYHFHTPSEHTIDGESYPIEMHLVHSNEEGGLAVVGILFEEGDENEVLGTVLDAAPPSQDSPAGQTTPLNPADLLPAGSEYYAYDGSLTTPPCSEGVSWHVFSQPSEASADQIATMVEYIGHSNRPIQELGARELRVGG